jgi:hypothetical protein
MTGPEYMLTRLGPDSQPYWTRRDRNDPGLRAVRVDGPLRLCPQGDPACADDAHVLRCPECGQREGLVLAMLVGDETIRAQCPSEHRWRTFLPAAFMQWLLANAT